MSRLEANVFPLQNLGNLKSQYRLYQIRGLVVEQDEYDHNVQILVGQLSRQMREPVAVILRDGEPHLAVREDAPEPQSPFLLVRATAYFKSTEATFTLDYEHPKAETEEICKRFLQFALEGELYGMPRLWRPGAGHPFFEREPTIQEKGIDVYRGYALRVVRHSESGFGLCVDINHKYVASNPLPAGLTRESFRRFKGRRCIYHYGSSWYEIRLHDHTDLSLDEQLIEDETGAQITLLQYIMRKARKPLPKEVLDLSPASPAVRYMTATSSLRHAAASLCYPVFDTSDGRIQGIHRRTILKPHIRRALIHDFVKTRLDEVKIGGAILSVGSVPWTVSTQAFLPPDLEFGNGKRYSVRGTSGAAIIDVERLGETRLSALYDENVGPHATRPLDRQYLIVPQSVVDSYGDAFIRDLTTAVNELYPQETPYDPIIVPYDDAGRKTFAAQGTAILSAVDADVRDPGFGIVMVHETSDRRVRQHDQLAAMIMHKLRQRGLFVSVIHTTVPKESYTLASGPDGRPSYVADRRRQGRLRGYLRNVAINKVLLTNERWPFVLATPLHADLTIAIDVQHNTACFTFMGKVGPDIRTKITTSASQKEKLSASHVKSAIVEVLRQEALLGMRDIKRVLVLRDGRFFGSEMKGVREAFDTLKSESHLSPRASPSFVEIHKTSAAPMRFFEVNVRDGRREFVDNPPIGSHFLMNDEDGYLCNTGQEFPRPGTTNPLHIRYVTGDMPFCDVLEDVYYQSCLTLTRPEDCSRLPFTMKLTDIRLLEHAGGYDEDALMFEREDLGATERRVQGGDAA